MIHLRICAPWIKKKCLIFEGIFRKLPNSSMRKVFLVASFFFLVAFAVAQQPPSAYLKAKSDLEAKEYGLAKLGFIPFLAEDKFGALSNYAAFHSAEAALQLGQAPEAIELLLALKGKSLEQANAQI